MPETDGASVDGRRRSALTVQGWLLVVLSIMGVVVLAGTLVGALLLHRTDEVTDELTNGIQPARVDAYVLQSDLLNQETAVRGYAIAADPQFLAPYTSGKADEQQAAARIRQHLANRTDLLADLDAIERAGSQWRAAFAEPLIANVTPGAPKLVDQAAAMRGKNDFDNIRKLFDKQNADLTAARDAAANELNGVQTWRNTVLAALVAAFVVTAILLGILVRWAVTRPLESLAAACRRNTEGRFSEPIGAEGPKDIRAIGDDVEQMRQRIVEALDVSQRARGQLSRQAATLREQTEELRRSNAELEQFAYVASHDLQEPLRKVASFCQLLEKRYSDKLDERGAQYISFAVDGAKRMQVLINDLLTFSRVGRLTAAHAMVSLDGSVDKALHNLTAAIDESGAQIVRPDDGLPKIFGDSTLLVMLWQNLLGNAIKFRQPGRAPRIVITCERSGADDQGGWLLTVSDNGIGIPTEFADKVFVIFQRLHGRDAYSGTGIGLALCKKIVEHHGGRIWIDPAYTDGTRFCFTLPARTPNELPAPILEGTAV
ncbi:HAMP domain-containing protein [Skermania sp. ID1734]|uniref:sensor histidine kinase n=1 Tax=Skermania sp. ID1734 TaxID=2597516 RepID=UPI00117C3AEC|nr:sensor histidine kinase [Skermania sp. ID1734]TSE02011.1 HAMP domain-containing protein [Skermania sp. ID1734]